LTYDEVGSGGAKARGCALIGLVTPLVTAFDIGDIVYAEAKARRGVLEKIVIKAIRPVAARRTHPRDVVLYVDTFNGLWNERDLVTRDEAELLVEEYRQRVQDELNQLRQC
jgi:hypothetical protein